jgi:hypothetical protein
MATVIDPFYYFHPSDEVASDATVTVQTGTEDSAYPATNAVDFTPALIAAPAKVDETTGIWQGDFGAAQRVDFVLLWSNFDAGVTAFFRMSDSSTFATTPVDAAFTIPARRADGYARKVWIDVRSISGYSTTGRRYFRVGASSASAEPIGIKVMAFSQVRQLSRDVQWGREDDEQQIAVVMKTDAGVRWGYDLASAPRVLRGSALLSDTDAEAVREWFRACAGVVTPTVIIPDPLVNDAWLVYWSPAGFSIESPSLVVARHQTKRAFTDANQTHLAFEEVTAGDPEWQ